MRYSYKRINTFIPKYLGNKEIKRIAFIKFYLESIQEKESIVFVIDEVGFGTKSLRNYAYSKIGEPVYFKIGKKLKYNLTCTTVISPYCVEAIKFFSAGGTKNEYFE